jgi:hypothetical protein
MKQPDGNDGPRGLPSIDDPLQDRNDGPGLWTYFVCVLLLVLVVVVVCVVLRPQIASPFRNISNDI